MLPPTWSLSTIGPRQHQPLQEIKACSSHCVDHAAWKGCGNVGGPHQRSAIRKWAEIGWGCMQLPPKGETPGGSKKWSQVYVGPQNVIFWVSCGVERDRITQIMQSGAVRSRLTIPAYRFPQKEFCRRLLEREALKKQKCGR